MQAQFDGKRLRDIVKTALTATVKRYKANANKYEIILTNFQQNQYLSPLIKELYDNSSHLSINVQQISDFLTQLGKVDYFKQVFDIVYYQLWLEFLIIAEGDFKSRIKEQQLLDFPRERKKQLESLKQMCMACTDNYTFNTQQTILQALESKPFFTQFLDCKDVSLKRKSSSSAKIKESIRKSKIQTLQTNKLEIVYMQTIEYIIKRIGIVNNIADFAEKRESLKDYIDNVMLSPQNLQCQVMKIHLKQVLLSILGIQLKSNNCKLIPQSQDITKFGFEKFSVFFTLQDATIQCQNLKLSVDEYFQYIRTLFWEEKAYIWYWPIYNGKSLISFILTQALQSQKKIDWLVENLNKCPPKLDAKINNRDGRTFLEEVLLQVPNESITIFRCILRLIKNQAIDIHNQFSHSEHSYFSLLRDKGVSVEKLNDISVLEQNNNKFYILCDQSKKKHYLPLTLEHVTELISKTQNPKFYEKLCFNDKNYQLIVTIVSNISYGVFISGSFGAFKKEVNFEGILNYGNLFEFGAQVKNFTWKIISMTWRQFPFSQNESEQLSQKIFNAKRGAEASISMEMSGMFYQKKQKMRVEINCQNWQVREIASDQDIAKSSFYKNFGYLVYVPSHKTKSAIRQQEQRLFQENDPYPQLGDGLKPLPPPEVHTFAHKFEFLGVFRTFFDTDQGYLIDDEKNVMTDKQHMIDYFKNWEEITIYRLVDGSLAEKSERRKQNRIRNNFFQINKKLYGSIIRQFRILENNLNKQIQTGQFDVKSFELEIINLKEDNQSYDFFIALIEYLCLKITKNNEQLNFKIELSPYQMEVMDEIMPNDVKILGKNQNRIEISSSKVNKQKFLQNMQSLDEVQEFTYEHPEAWEEMKKKYGVQLRDMNVVQLDICEEVFKVQMRLKDYPKFRQMLQECYNMVKDNNQGELKQMRIQQEAQFMHIYRNELMKVDPQIMVSKIGNDVLIEFKKKLEKRVIDALKNIKEVKDRQFFTYMKKSSQEHVFTNVSHILLFQLRDKAINLLEKSARLGVKPKIQLNLSNGSNYNLKAEQISPQQEKQFNQIMENFKRRYDQYQRLKSKINDTNKLITKTTNKLPKKKMKQPKISKLATQFEKNLQREVVKMIGVVTKKMLEGLEIQFFAFIKTQDLENALASKLPQQSSLQVEKQINEFELFGRPYIEIFVDKLAQQLKIKPSNQALEKMMKEMEPTIKQTTEKYKANQLKSQQFEKYLKSLNILSIIFLGQQLPITSHLPSFKDKLQKNDVVMVKVGTGSGKSTVIPPFLIGVGYNKVVVTQPRRLPCRQIYNRINSVFGQGISGYEVGDGKKDENNRLLYMTDGLLKMQALFKIQVFDGIDVLIIDEIHERSANIDLLLLILYVYFKNTKRNLKLVLCSATIDTKIGELLKEAGLKVDTFSVNVNRHKVDEFSIKQGTIIDKTLELAKKLQPDEQMLIFYPGIRQVNQTVKTLEASNRNAYAITANQNPNDQQKYLQKGSIFVSTAIAETSLTFRKLKYVIDSRMSRMRSFNSELEIMETEESYSSKSSIQQRKGRVGRTCPGQYHYMEYIDFSDQNAKQYSPTELQKVDLTPYVFEILLMQGNNFGTVKILLSKLKHDPIQFDKKMEYSRCILNDLNVLKLNATLGNSAYQLIKYGNLGNPQHNYALYSGSLANCQVNIIYLTSFFMVASNVSGEILKYIKGLFKGGDLKIIHDFIAKICQEISLITLNENPILNVMKQKCPYVADKSWCMTIFRVIKKVKQLYSNCSNFVPTTDWNTVVATLIQAYKNKIFFNQSIFGGNKAQFQKLRDNTTFNFQQRQEDKIHYKMDMNSALYNRDTQPSLILSLNSAISPEGQCVLSVCEVIDANLVNQSINIIVIGKQCNQKYFQGTTPIKESELFEQLSIQMRSNYNKVKVNIAFPNMTFSGKFKEITRAFSSLVEPKRRNAEVKFNLNLLLDEAINDRELRSKKNMMMPSINKQMTKQIFEKLTNFDFKNMFQTTKFELANNYGVEIQWDAKPLEPTFIAKNIKNIHVERLLSKLVSFFKWFSDSQIICKQQFKIRPRCIEEGPKLAIESRKKIISRVNNIVDSRIQPYVLKGWVNGKGAGTRYARTARMIAVSWVLTNIFGCVIKGGFVRDWVVNGQEVLPAGNLANLLQKNARNQYLEVVDDAVTPSDIDAELSPYVLFDEQKFKKQMSKLGITIKIEEDGWRKHIIFDQKAITGGFTADLIQTYTSMCHDTYDFDVNIFYLKKDNLNGIGLKIPLQFQGKKEKIELEELLASCQKKEMKKLKENIWKYRLDKFRARGWTIKENQVYLPIVYKSFHTQCAPVPPQEIQRVSDVFFKEMVKKRNVKVVKIESLRNTAWDNAFKAIEHWIITQIERSRKNADPVNNSKKNVNSNSKMLFHGSKIAGIQGIKEFGFDSRYFNKVGFYGRGAYFADDPELSDRFCEKNSEGLKQMFVVKVALGNQEVLKNAQNNKLGPDKGYHSILGQAGGHNEYIIERWGQAKPMYLISYK